MAAVRDLKLPRRRAIPARWLRLRAVRSSGPGGQNVNKVATRVELALDLGGVARTLGAAAAERVRARWPRRLNTAGRLVVRCGRTRQRARNLELAHRQLEALLTEALRTRRVRRATRPTRASRERRIKAKKQRSRIKQYRRRPTQE